MYVIKLGGSVITDKSKKNTYKHDVTLRLVSEIVAAQKQIIVVHGAGSFGHILAKKYELHKGYKNKDKLPGIAEVQRDVKVLSLKVLDTFLEGGMNAVSLAPSAFLVNQASNIKHMDTGNFRRYLEADITPITFGDVVVDESLMFSIVSGDQLMLELAKVFRPEMVIFVADVDGIYTGNPNLDKDAQLLPTVNKEVLSGIGESQGEVDDVTGSILGKSKIMLEIAAHGMDTIILNGNAQNRLKDALMGRNVICTKFEKMN
jgi:isopentenyl phosphate kinase